MVLILVGPVRARAQPDERRARPSAWPSPASCSWSSGSSRSSPSARTDRGGAPAARPARRCPHQRHRRHPARGADRRPSRGGRRSRPAEGRGVRGAARHRAGARDRTRTSSTIPTSRWSTTRWPTACTALEPAGDRGGQARAEREALRQQRRRGRGRARRRGGGGRALSSRRSTTGTTRSCTGCSTSPATARSASCVRVEARMLMPPPPAGDLRWDADVAGGGLMDVGCYAVHAIRDMSGVRRRRAVDRAGLGRGDPGPSRHRRVAGRRSGVPERAPGHDGVRHDARRPRLLPAAGRHERRGVRPGVPAAAHGRSRHRDGRHRAAGRGAGLAVQLHLHARGAGAHHPRGCADS